MQRPASTDEDSPASSSAGFDPAQYQHWTSQAHQSSSKTHPPAASSFAASAADTAAAMSMSLRQTSDELQSHASQVHGHIHYIMHVVLSHQWYVDRKIVLLMLVLAMPRCLGMYTLAIVTSVCCPLTHVPLHSFNNFVTTDSAAVPVLQVSSEQLRPLPISAVSLGKAPLRSDSVATGSDILLDALREEEVAAHAQRFLETEQGQAILKSPGTVSNG